MQKSIVLRKTGLMMVSLLFVGIASAQSLFVYPAKGQSGQQQQKDIAECSSWAQANTGSNQADGSTAPPPQQHSGGGLRGAVGGAAIGAMLGDSSDAGKGAVAGALFGGLRQSRSNQRSQQQYQQQRAQNEAARQDNYNRAYSACLEGRGYTVK